MSLRVWGWVMEGRSEGQNSKTTFLAAGWVSPM